VSGFGGPECRALWGRIGGGRRPFPQGGCPMSRKVVGLVVVALLAGATGYAVLAQPPQRPGEWDGFRPVKAGNQWQYCTLTEVQLDGTGRLAVFVEGAGTAAVCNGGWIEAAEKLGLKLDPQNPRKNEPWGRRVALDQMGALGWELVSTHGGESGRVVWVFK